MKQWYAVHTKPKSEDLAEANLVNQGFESYLPKIAIHKHQRGRWKLLIEPLFPRYIFIAFDLEKDNSATIRSTRGAVGLVRFGDRVVPVPSEVIEALKETENPEDGIHYPDKMSLRRGDRVLLVEGPFAGLQGVFHETKGSDRVSILLNLLGQASRVTVSRDALATPT